MQGPYIKKVMEHWDIQKCVWEVCVQNDPVPGFPTAKGKSGSCAMKNHLL